MSETRTESQGSLGNPPLPRRAGMRAALIATLLLAQCAALYAIYRQHSQIGMLRAEIRKQADLQQQLAARVNEVASAGSERRLPPLHSDAANASSPGRSILLSPYLMTPGGMGGVWPTGSAVVQLQEYPSDMDRLWAAAMRDFERMERFINFDEGWPSLVPEPTMDMRQEHGQYVVSFSLPGLDPSEVTVTLEGRLLRVSGELKAQTRQSPYTGQRRFERAVILPGPVRPESEATASYNNGVLRVVVPQDTQMSAPPQRKKLL